MMKMKILVTGATGFVGTHLIEVLIKQLPNAELVLLGRFSNDMQKSLRAKYSSRLSFINVKSIEMLKAEQVPEGISSVVHLAAKAHVTESTELASEYNRVNTEGTRVLAQVALEKGVEHFIYLSSIKVNGDVTTHRGFTESDSVNPIGIYADSKYQAEGFLNNLPDDRMRVSIVRPPLVYGKGVKANMNALAALVRITPFIPFGMVDNKRSLISVNNLNSFIMTLLCKTPQIHYQKQVFLVSDSAAVSTPELCRNIAKAINKKVFMLKVPSCVLVSLLALVGKKNMWEKLSESLVVEGKNPKKYFHWQPSFRMVDELSYLNEESS